MGFLDRFSPPQRQALMIGVPAVAGFVLLGKLFRPKAPAGGVSAVATPSTDAIGVGQLSDFESHISDQVNTLATLIAGWEPTTPAASPPPPAPPPAAPDTTAANSSMQSQPVASPQLPPPALDPGLVAAMQAGGESIVQVAQSTGGGWLYETNKGGVYTAGGAPFFGSYLGYAGGTDDPAREIALHGHFASGGLVTRPGGHYSLINANGEVYNF